MGAQQGRRPAGEGACQGSEAEVTSSPAVPGTASGLQSQGLGAASLASLGLRAFWTCPV